MIAQNWAKLQQLDDGARYHKVDLHVHTPASYEYEDKSIAHKELVQRATGAGLDMIAVTDHHTAAGYQAMRNAAKGTGLVVLPGVEVSAQGIHIIAIFPEERTPEQIDYLLSRLKVRPEEMGKPETTAGVGLSVPTVLEEIWDAEGLPIAAHVDSDKGLTETIRGQARIKLVQHPALKVVEVTKTETLQYFDGTDPNYRRELTCIQSSDAHHPEQIGQRATWVKMGDCTFQSLRQIIFEPALRVRLEPPPQADYPRILGLAVSGGIYEGQPFRFNANLNCIIGGRGAGKSAVLDFLRFALDYFPRSADFRKSFYKRIADILGQGESAAAYVETSQGVFAVQRRLLDCQRQPIPGADPEVISITCEEKVYQIVQGEPIDTQQTAQDVLGIEVFGQGEVFELTKKADDQLTLIDEYAAVADLTEEEKRLVDQLQENSKKVVNLREKSQELAEELDELDGIIGEIKGLDKRLKAKVFKEHTLWEAEKAFLEDAQQFLKEEQEQTSAWADETSAPELAELDASSPNKAQLDEVDTELRNLYAALAQSRRLQDRRIRKVINRLSEIQGDWLESYRKHDAEYARQIVEAGEQDLEAISDRRDTLKREQRRLQTQVRPKHNKAEAQLKALEQSREALLHKLSSLRDDISDARQRKVQAMCPELEKGDVKIELRRRSNRRRFSELLEGIYTGSGIKHRERHLQRICDLATPGELAGLLAQRHSEHLIDRFQLTEDAADKMLAGTGPQHIHAIEMCALDDELMLYLRKTGAKDFSPLSDLSYGEKCTAVFSIALIGRDNPLLVDQPEDELDHAFIIDNIVEHIADVKDRRQLIICTHNPNIPVLGDAELVLKVGKVAGVERCTLETSGAFETPAIIDHLQDLEGGPEAFQKRREKYGVA